MVLKSVVRCVLITYDCAVVIDNVILLSNGL